MNVDKELAFAAMGVNGGDHTGEQYEKKQDELRKPQPSGSGVDVTASVGQTIVVEEVDANGKPTKWKAEEYQPRTHWTEEVMVLEETTLVLDPNAEQPPMFTPLAVPSVGGVCKVTYNGTEYTCEAVDGSAMTGIPGIVMLGNIDLAMGTGDTGEPFVAIIGMAGEGGGQLQPLDSSETFTLSIKGIFVTKIPKKYIPALSDEFAIHFVGNPEADAGTDGAVQVVETAEAIYEALSNKKTLVGYLNANLNGFDTECVTHDYTVATTQLEGNDVFFVSFCIWNANNYQKIHQISITVVYMGGVHTMTVDTFTGEVLT